MDTDELVFHPWTIQVPRTVPRFVGGQGSYLVDVTGRRYLDLGSQLVFTNLGHQHPRIVAAITEQADRLCTLGPSYASDIRGEAARMIVELAPEGLGRTVELVRDRETREPIVPAGAGGDANAPMAAFTKACLGHDVAPLVLGNRVHIAPPLNVSDADLEVGLSVLDEALAEADAFVA